MVLDLAAFLSNGILELPTSRAESIAERDVHVFVGLVFWSLMAHDDLIAGNGHVEPNAIKPTMFGMPISVG